MEIEKRLGLFKPDKLSVLQQMANKRKTKQNIELLTKELVLKPCESTIEEDSSK